MDNKLLIATNNAGKLKEFQFMLRDIPVKLLSLADVGITAQIEETGKTYTENAEIKAAGYAALSSLITLADDSGLEVDALGGEPGVMSARYAGEKASDSDRVQFLLSKIRNVPQEKRTAHFKCVIAVAIPEKKIELRFGQCDGFISFEPHGTNGFGYDPVFYLPEYGKTVAELPSDLKNRISHRGRAAENCCSLLLSLFSSYNRV
ncbi:MAG: XTP/dITP diphosphatase [Chloroflexi bacterium]|nr:XTP/dITP diphosphatase [Chloroflexota bacterium]